MWYPILAVLPYHPAEERALTQRSGDDTATPDVSIVIRCFDEEKHIGRLLTGIQEQTLAAEVIAVDSGSSDRTVDIARGFPGKIVEIKPEDFSFGRALNLGCRASQGDILVFISAHCYPTHDDWLERLVEPFSDPAVACAYGKQRGNQATRFSEHRVFEQWFPDAPDPDQKHAFCNNANCAVRRSVWDHQPYDEDLTGLEDLDWAQKALDAGHRLAYVPDAEIIHVHEETPARIYNRYRREAIALKRIFPQEGFGFRDFFRLLAASVRADLVVARAERSLLENLYGILMFRVMQYWGALRGFEQEGPVASDLRRKFYYANSPRTESVNNDLPQDRRRIRYLDAKGVGQ